jgi:hypothetical protein
MPFRAFSFCCRRLQPDREYAVRPPAGCARRGGCIPCIQTQGFSSSFSLSRQSLIARRHCSRCAQNARARTRPCLDYHYAHYCACVGSSLARTPPPCISPAWPGLFTLPQCRSQTPSSSFPPVSIHERDLLSTNFLQDNFAKISNLDSFWLWCWL